MDDKQILDLYWERSEAAISETSKNIYSKISFHFLKEYNKTAKDVHQQVS